MTCRREDNIDKYFREVLHQRRGGVSEMARAYHVSHVKAKLISPLDASLPFMK